MIRAWLSLCLLGARLATASTVLRPPEETKMAKAHDVAPSQSKVPNTIPEKSAPAQKAAPKAVPALAVLVGSLRKSPAQSQTLTAGEVAKARTKPSQVAEGTKWAEVSHTARARIDPSVSTLVHSATA
jgi:hypothetical protein